MEDAIELGLEGLDHSVEHGFDKLPKSIREGHLPSLKLPRRQSKSQSQSQSQNRDYDNYYNDDRRSPSSPSSSRQRSSYGREGDECDYQPSPFRNARRDEGVTSPSSQRDLLSPRTATAATFDRDSRYGYGSRPRSSSAYNDHYEVSIYPVLNLAPSTNKFHLPPFFSQPHSESDESDIERRRPHTSKPDKKPKNSMDRLKKVFSADDLDTETKAIGVAAVGLFGLWGYTTLMDRQKIK